MPFTVAEGDALLADNFAPWVRDLGLVLTDVGTGAATLRLRSAARR
jgi:hypothetical protein